MSDANAISDLERAEHLGYADGKGVKRVSIFNDGVQINAATEEKQDAIIAATGRGLNIPTFDYASQTQTATTDTWTFKTGGAGGTTVATVVITYVDATKEVISSVAQS